jgi:hypothetical protein
MLDGYIKVVELKVRAVSGLLQNAGFEGTEATMNTLVNFIGFQISWFASEKKARELARMAY